MAKANEVELTVDQGKLIAHAGDKQKELSYEQAFSLGYSLLKAGRYEQAQGIFTVLTHVRGHGPRAKIMLARCKAEFDGFKACAEILHAAFEGEDGPVAEEFQAAFVFHAMGLREDAIREIVKVVNEHPDLPTACLFLGDLFREAGKLDKAAQCWKLAIKRDRRGGGVAVAARKALKQLAKRLKEAEKKKVGKKSSRATKQKKRP
jgi:tetratricopeptide (TPR) repeat protein